MKAQALNLESWLLWKGKQQKSLHKLWPKLQKTEKIQKIMVKIVLKKKKKKQVKNWKKFEWDHLSNLVLKKQP